MTCMTDMTDMTDMREWAWGCEQYDSYDGYDEYDGIGFGSRGKRVIIVYASITHTLKDKRNNEI